MTDTISCPSCQRTLRVPESLLGQLVKCPTCRETFTAALEGPPPRREAPPPPPRPRDYAGDEPPPRPYRDERDDWEDDDRPRRREKPSKVQAIGVMTLVGGILATLLGVGLTLGGFPVCCFWPGTYFSLVMGIMAIVKGADLLGANAHRSKPPMAVAVMQIINGVNGDFVNLTMGIITLVFLNDPEVKRYFRRR
jgi:predicted Zn finger-like uncharacterized protein